jgi:cytoskeletal protein CcmA (bactofilin family)
MIQYQNPTSKLQQPGITTLGQAMPDILDIPVLTVIDTAAAELPSKNTSNKPSISMIEEGVTFTGNATLQGACTIAGQIYGNLKEQAGATLQVVITETGYVKGDIFSHKVSIMGTYSGTVDASGGSVDLHPKSVVSGHIRYGQLQVNGADLNATLERAAKAVS